VVPCGIAGRGVAPGVVDDLMPLYVQLADSLTGHLLQALINENKIAWRGNLKI
jgi:hypothetical protein